MKKVFRSTSIQNSSKIALVACWSMKIERDQIMKIITIIYETFDEINDIVSIRKGNSNF